MLIAEYSGKSTGVATLSVNLSAGVRRSKVQITTDGVNTPLRSSAYGLRCT